MALAGLVIWGQAATLSLILEVALRTEALESQNLKLTYEVEA
jgi:hypothetical protein